MLPDWQFPAPPLPRVVLGSVSEQAGVRRRRAAWQADLSEDVRGDGGVREQSVLETALTPISTELDWTAFSTALCRARAGPVCSSLPIAHESSLTTDQWLLCKAAASTSYTCEFLGNTWMKLGLHGVNLGFWSTASGAPRSKGQKLCLLLAGRNVVLAITDVTDLLLLVIV